MTETQTPYHPNFNEENPAIASEILKEWKPREAEKDRLPGNGFLCRQNAAASQAQDYRRGYVDV